MDDTCSDPGSVQGTPLTLEALYSGFLGLVDDLPRYQQEMLFSGTAERAYGI